MRRSITAMLSSSLNAPVRTLRILPLSTRCEPLVEERISTTAIAITTTPTPKNIANCLLIWTGCLSRTGPLISQQFAETLQADDIIADGFNRGGDGNGQQQANGAPQRAPEHERDRYHQRI